MARPLLVSSLVSALVSALTYLAMQFFVAPRLPVLSAEVPPLHGLSPEQARGLLEPRGLLLVLDGERTDDTTAAGTVCDQKPLGGSRLRRGEAVYATVARAPVMPQVPSLTGQTLDAARVLLKEARLKLGNVREAPSDSAPRGQVVSSQPPPGATVKADTAVDVVLSGGPNVQPVPQVVGKRLSKAKELLQAAGFAIGDVKTGSNDDYDEGIVIKQNPAGAAQASPGVKVDLTVNE